MAAASAHACRPTYDAVQADRGKGGRPLLTLGYLSKEDALAARDMIVRALQHAEFVGAPGCRFPYNDSPYTTRRDLGGRFPACPESSLTVRMDVVPHCLQTYDTSTKPFESKKIVTVSFPEMVEPIVFPRGQHNDVVARACCASRIVKNVRVRRTYRRVRLERGCVDGLLQRA
jgi:hypothetical protein